VKLIQFKNKMYLNLRMSAHIYLWEEFTVGQKLAWIFSTVSNALWLFVFIPQLYQNYKAKDSKGLSLLLLFCLILGDIFSIVSAHAKNLNPVIIYAAAYHIILDVIIIAQILYYRRQSILIQTGSIIEDTITESSPLIDNVSDVSEDFISKYPYFNLGLSEFIFVIISIFTVITTQVFMVSNKEYNNITADVIAWLATAIFMLARIPQIILNFKRKSTNGLSLLSFIIINIANFFFLLSVLIILYDLTPNQYMEYVLANIQWVVGSSSTTLFDCVIFYQFYKYRNYNVFEYER
jgi:uncharacterized protein with PQ loop repeat